MNIDVFETLKYVLGSLPGMIGLLYSFFQKQKTETIKDYKEFLIELEAAHDKLIEAKEEILKLTFDNKRLTEINTTLNEKIQGLEKQIQEIKRKINIEEN